MKDEPMPKAIQHLMPRSHKEIRIDCDKSSNCEPIPNVSSYHDDTKLKEEEKDFKPRPNVSSYHDDDSGLKQEKDFEPRPNAYGYRDDDVGLKQEKKFRAKAKCI
ncbi:putative 26S protease regulatory subunit 10B -like protein A-like [Capsicum annuum]|uniref:Organ-specific protein S2-like n=1 Tax=Capsicum annuum TaxID=4072 RepID=A0A2G2YJJ7_CAPAN|nr:putative 26S protease regulatory subunit 10B -like protein A-like [Capsicum annuum]PHT69918.1 hypothetical protein T459_25022 [Capsicum annuum]